MGDERPVCAGSGEFNSDRIVTGSSESKYLLPTGKFHPSHGRFRHPVSVYIARSGPVACWARVWEFEGCSDADGRRVVEWVLARLANGGGGAWTVGK